MRPWNVCIATAICLVLAVHPDQALPAEKAAVRQMDFNEFTGKVKGRDSFEITVQGRVRESYFTGKKYVHFETVAYFGRDDIRSTYQILYHTQEDFTVMHGTMAVAVRYSQVRTCLSPSLERKFTKEDLADHRSEKEKSLRSILDNGEAAELLLVEYGLEAGKKYYGSLKTESYHLPPRERGGKPERREKTVLVISDRAFPNDIEVTPVYKGWSY